MHNVKKIEHRIKCLEERHRELDKDIQVAHDTFKEDFVVGALKKQKLQIKDKIRELQSQLVDSSND